jgi:hypothetical protein
VITPRVDAQAGDTVSGSSLFLTPGKYHVRFIATGTGKAALPPLFYWGA